MSPTHKTTTTTMTTTTMTTTTMTTMMMLPDELILFVQKNVNDHATLLNLKMCCTYFNKGITQVSLTRIMINDKLSNYNDLSLCINVDCYYDTQDIYENHYYEYAGRYIHHHQPALNNRQIRINKKDYNVRSPYCCECFIKHVLIGSNTNVRRDLYEDEVIIDY